MAGERFVSIPYAEMLETAWTYASLQLLALHSEFALERLLKCACVSSGSGMPILTYPKILPTAVVRSQAVEGASLICVLSHVKVYCNASRRGR